MKKLLSSIIITIGFVNTLSSQKLPVGSWNTYPSFRSFQQVEANQNYVFGLSENAIQSLDRNSGVLRKISTTEGLFSGGLSSMSFSSDRDQLYIGYIDGTIEIAKNDGVYSIETIRELDLVGDKNILSFYEFENDVFISSKLGLLRLDLTQNQLIDFYQEIGPNGVEIAASESIVLNDTLFVITNIGLQKAYVQSNLLDFNNWEHLVMDSLFSLLTIYEDSVWLVNDKNNLGIIKENQFESRFTFNDDIIDIEIENNEFFVLTSTNIYQLENKELSIKKTDDFKDVNSFSIEGDQIYLATNIDGLKEIAFSNETEEIIKISGPVSDNVEKLNVTSSGVSLVFASIANPSEFEDYASFFYDNKWENFQVDNEKAYSSLITDALLLIGTDKGLKDVKDDSYIFFSTGDISDLELFNNSIWASEYNGDISLHQVSASSLEQYPAAVTGSIFPIDITISRFGTIWILGEDEQRGVAIWEPVSDQFRRINSSDGILSNNISSIEISYDDEAWLLSQAGIASFFDASNVFNEDEASEVLFQGEPLLPGIRINDIEFDGGNRIWMGTDEGIWIFDANLENQIEQYSLDNSPLLSNTILQLEYQGNTGLMYVSTNGGLISFQTDSSEPQPEHNNVTIFPNPARLGRNSVITFSGLAAEVILKITTIDGLLIDEIKANGSTASWNLVSYRGEQAEEGVYLVFSSSPDGEETFIGKFILIND